MKTRIRILHLALAVCPSIVGLSASAALEEPLREPAVAHVWTFTSTRDYSRGLDFSTIHPVASLREMNTNDVAEFIPANDLRDVQSAPNRNTSTAIASRIVDHSLSSLFNSAAVKSSDLGRAAHSVEHHLDSNVAFGSSQPEAIHHNLKFSMRPTEQRAMVEYTGLTNAQLTYYASASIVNFEVNDATPILNTKVVYNHINMPSDTRNTLSLRWIW